MRVLFKSFLNRVVSVFTVKGRRGNELNANGP